MGEQDGLFAENMHIITVFAYDQHLQIGVFHQDGEQEILVGQLDGCADQDKLGLIVGDLGAQFDGILRFTVHYA